MIEVNNMAHADLVARAAGVLFNMRYDHVMSRAIDGELAGGVVFNGWNAKGSVNVHMAGFRSDWATPNMVKQIFRYCFVTLGVKKVFALVPSDNTKALEINRRLGFNQEVTIADVFADCDLVVMSMRRDECRWLPRVKQ